MVWEDEITNDERSVDQERIGRELPRLRTGVGLVGREVDRERRRNRTGPDDRREVRVRRLLIVEAVAAADDGPALRVDRPRAADARRQVVRVDRRRLSL